MLFRQSKFDPECYVAVLRHLGRRVHIDINLSDPDQLPQAIPIATNIWKHRSKLFKTFKDHASEKLLDVLNDRISQVREFGTKESRKYHELTIREFRQLLAAEMRIELHYEPSQIYFQICSFHRLFASHAIQATFSKKEKLMHSEVVNLY